MGRLVRRFLAFGIVPALGFVFYEGENLTFEDHASVNTNATRVSIDGENVWFQGLYHRTKAARVMFEDPTDYTGDVRRYMQRHPNGVPGDVPSATHADATRTWGSILAKHRVKNVDSLSIKQQDDARKEFMERMFGNSAGVLQGSNFPETFLAQMSWTGLSEIFAELPMKMLGYSYPGWYRVVPPLVDTFARVTQRNASYLRREGTQRLLFINEPYIQQPWAKEQYLAFDRLRNMLQPHWPPFAQNPEERQRIFLVDQAGSSHGFHWHDAVWNTQVLGRKAWFLMYGNKMSEQFEAPIIGDHTEVVPNACAYLMSRELPPGTVSFTQHPGETVLLPADVWHTTCALDEFTSAFGGWMQKQRSADRTYESAQKASRW